MALTGCSGGGKSTLLAELARHGVRTFKEPGRIVVRRALSGEGGALPEGDITGFTLACLEISRAQLAEAARETRPCIFDRTPIDHLSALRDRGVVVPDTLSDTIQRAGFHAVVAFAPPWPELFVPDGERRHGLGAAVEECERLRRDYAALGFTLLELPRLPVEARAVWLLRHHPALTGRAARAAPPQALR